EVCLADAGSVGQSLLESVIRLQVEAIREATANLSLQRVITISCTVRQEIHRARIRVRLEELVERLAVRTNCRGRNLLDIGVNQVSRRTRANKAQDGCVGQETATRQTWEHG